MAKAKNTGKQSKSKVGTEGQITPLERLKEMTVKYLDTDKCDILQIKIIRIAMQDPRLLAWVDAPVVCDICNGDFSHSLQCGGFICFANAFCPDCGERNLEEARTDCIGEDEPQLIECPKGAAFRNLVKTYRLARVEVESGQTI